MTCFQWYGLVVVGGLCVLIAGCATEDKLSYSEALNIYNAELEALQRLETQRAALQAQLEPSAGDILGGLLGEATKMAGELRGELQQSVDDLGGPAGTADDLADPSAAEDMMGELSGQMAEDVVANAEMRADIEAQIAMLDKEIAAQKLRVERAKADRDAADARRSAGQE